VRGRKKTPTKAKIIHGTFRKDRAPKNEPEPTPVPEIPKPPSSLLSSAGRKMWRSLAEELFDKGLLTVVDLGALEACCDAYGTIIECNRAIYKMIEVEQPDGTIKKRRRTLAEYLDGRNYRTMPEVATKFKAYQTYKSYLTEFGLTPAARARIDLPDTPEKKAEPMEMLEREEM